MQDILGSGTIQASFIHIFHGKIMCHERGEDHTHHFSNQERLALMDVLGRNGHNHPNLLEVSIDEVAWSRYSNKGALGPSSFSYDWRIWGSGEYPVVLDEEFPIAECTT